MPITQDNVVISNYTSLEKDPTGFLDPENVSVSYDSSTRRVTLRGDVKAFYRGRVIKAIRNGWVSDPHPTAFGSYFLYYDGARVRWETSPWSFDYLPICYVYYSSANKFATREIHSFMPYSAHNVLHHTIGSYRLSGGDLSAYVLGSTTASERRPNISTCYIQDEDLTTECAAHTSKLYTKMYLDSAGATNTFTVETADIVPLSGSQPYWNEYTGTVWKQTLMSNNSYQSLWLMAFPASISTTCQKYRFIWIQGQSNGNLTSEQGKSPANLNLGSLTSILPEFVFIAKVIIQYIGGDWKLTSVDRISGSKVSQTIYPSGSFLSTVTTDGTTITGTGIPSDPLVASSTSGMTSSQVLSKVSLRV